MNPRAALATIALLFIAAGTIIGFMPRGGGFHCGSVLRPDTDVAAMYDTLSGSPGGAKAACDETLSAGKPLTYGALGVGAVAGLLAIAVGNGRKQMDAEQAVAEQPTSS